jgi:soluble lytic murein transglycosylase
VAREHPFSLHRVVPLVLVLALGIVALLALRGPSWYQRLYHPLRYQDVIARQAEANSIDPYLVTAVINAESGFREGVVSGAGAVGLMQVKPSTAAAVAPSTSAGDEMNAAALADPTTNIRVGTRYLAFLLKRYDGDVQLALAAYNAGLGNADRWAAEARRTRRPFSEKIAFPETARYVDDVLTQEAVYRTLYPGVFSTARK